MFVFSDMDVVQFSIVYACIPYEIKHILALSISVSKISSNRLEHFNYPGKFELKSVMTSLLPAAPPSYKDLSILIYHFSLERITDV